MRATLLFSFVAVALPLAAQTPPSPPAPPPAPAAKRTVELTGLALVNGFFTNARVNNSDVPQFADGSESANRSEEHTSELQSRLHLVCRLLLEKKKQSRKPTR